MATKCLIKKVKVVDAPSKYHNKVVDILVLDNRIAEIKSSINPASSVKIIQGEDLHASISWMDLGTQTGEPGLEHREDWGHWQERRKQEVMVYWHLFPILYLPSKVRLIYIL